MLDIYLMHNAFHSPRKKRKRKYVHKQAKMKSQRNVTYNKKIK